MAEHSRIAAKHRLMGIELKKPLQIHELDILKAKPSGDRNEVSEPPRRRRK